MEKRTDPREAPEPRFENSESWYMLQGEEPFIRPFALIHEDLGVSPWR
jgi:hypothetical protein